MYWRFAGTKKAKSGVITRWLYFFFWGGGWGPTVIRFIHENDEWKSSHVRLFAAVLSFSLFLLLYYVFLCFVVAFVCLFVSFLFQFTVIFCNLAQWKFYTVSTKERCLLLLWVIMIAMPDCVGAETRTTDMCPQWTGAASFRRFNCVTNQ